MSPSLWGKITRIRKKNEKTLLFTYFCTGPPCCWVSLLTWSDQCSTTNVTHVHALSPSLIRMQLISQYLDPVTSVLLFTLELLSSPSHRTVSWQLQMFLASGPCLTAVFAMTTSLDVIWDKSDGILSKVVKRDGSVMRCGVSFRCEQSVRQWRHYGVCGCVHIEADNVFTNIYLAYVYAILSIDYINLPHLSISGDKHIWHRHTENVWISATLNLTFCGSQV